MRIALVALVFSALAGCGDDGETSTRKAAGTPTDLVEVCERPADVCRLDGAKLGVCVQPTGAVKRLPGSALASTRPSGSGPPR